MTDVANRTPLIAAWSARDMKILNHRPFHGPWLKLGVLLASESKSGRYSNDTVAMFRVKCRVSWNAWKHPLPFVLFDFGQGSRFSSQFRGCR